MQDIIKITSKYGLEAHNTRRWASISCPSTRKVTSTCFLVSYMFWRLDKKQVGRLKVICSDSKDNDIARVKKTVFNRAIKFRLIWKKTDYKRFQLVCLCLRKCGFETAAGCDGCVLALYPSPTCLYMHRCQIENSQVVNIQNSDSAVV